jgi:glycosyltransferase involved in cell wall biosynthesis
MRILQLTSARQFGGGERHFVDLTNALVQGGHEVFVALIPESPLLPELPRIPDADILELPLRNSLDISAAFTLRRFVHEHQVEIIHAHVARDYPLAALAAGRAGQTRLVLTRHVLFPLSKLHKLTRRRVSRVIAVSNAVARELKQQGVFRAAQIKVVRHGIDLSRYPSRRENRQPRENELLRVGMLGELSPTKGQTDFVHAAAIVAAQRDDVEFVIAGRDKSADGRNWREIESLIAECGLGSRMSLVDSIVDVPAFLSGLDLFVSASHTEAFGLAIVEAMACGVPVVATRTAGACEIIGPEEIGRLVPIGGIDDLARTITELLSDEEQRENLAEKARRNIAERFSLERMVEETEGVYREILAQRDNI